MGGGLSIQSNILLKTDFFDSLGMAFAILCFWGFTEKEKCDILHV